MIAGNKKNYVFFDVDETLINFKSMFSFLDYWHQLPFSLTACSNFRKKKFILTFWLLKKFRMPRTVLNRFFYQHFSGVLEKTLMKAGEDWWYRVRGQRPYHVKVLAALQSHQKKGDEVVLVSGSLAACLTPIANDLNIKNVLCTDQLTQCGVYTGGVKKPNIGEEKTNRIQQFSKGETPPVDFRQAHAYGDHASDLSMLKRVGHPVCVGDNPVLALYVKQVQGKKISFV